MSAKNGTITMKDIALRCGVTYSTVQIALSGVGRVSPKTAQRIKAIAEEMGYNPARHDSARRLVMRRYNKAVLNRSIAVYLPLDIIDEPYFNRVFIGMAKEAAEREFNLLMVSSHHDYYTDAQGAPLPDGIIRGEVDGAILMTNDHSWGGLITRFREETAFAERPLVTLMNPSPHSTSSSIRIDDFAGAYAAMTHLLELGHRQILHFYDQPLVGADENVPLSIAMLREQGYRQACHDFGLDPSAHLHGVLTMHRGFDSAIDEGVKVLRGHPEITAVLARHDLFAQLLVQKLLANGWRVPEELSLVGFDDTRPLLDTPQQVTLTTVHSPLEEIGREAVTLIIGRILGEIKSDQHLVLPVSLVVRQSTAPPRGDAQAS